LEKKNILLICGGNSTEHDISLRSANYIENTIKPLLEYNVVRVAIGKDSIWRDSTGVQVELLSNNYLAHDKNKIKIDFAIPCIHGFPGETGDIQSLFEMNNLPYLGSNSEASKLCFNKISSKLWFDALSIPNTPYLFLSSMNELNKAKEAMSQWRTVFVKASSQGSSVGCYQVTDINNLENSLQKAFSFSPYVLVEKSLVARELEIATYEIDGVLQITDPGEILCPTKFYSFEEKYDNKGQTTTIVKAENLNNEIIFKMKEYARKAFTHLKIRHLSRIDFFYTTDHELYLNEINTFPGMTPISMFPKMMEANGHTFSDFIKSNFR